MIRLILIAILSCSAQADLQVKRYDDGYLFSFVEDGVHNCWGMPDLADLNYFDLSWLKVTDTAVRYNWSKGDAAVALECESAPVSRVVQMVEGDPVYMKVIDAQGRLIRGIEIPGGLPCGDRLSRWFNTQFYYHAVTYNGVTGIALCY
jgi:hypothetical protein